VAVRNVMCVLELDKASRFCMPTVSLSQSDVEKMGVCYCLLISSLQQHEESLKRLTGMLAMHKIIDILFC